MRSLAQTAVKTLVATGLLMVLSSCQENKKTDHQNLIGGTRGNVVSDGITASSTTNLNGENLSLAVGSIYLYGPANNYSNFDPYYQNNVNAVPGGVANNNYYNQYNPYAYNAMTVRFEVNINGSAFPVVSVANSLLSQPQTIGSMVLHHQSRCADTQCTNVFLNIFISSVNEEASEMKQLGLMVDMQGRRISAAIELQGSSSALLNFDQMIQGLMSIRN